MDDWKNKRAGKKKKNTNPYQPRDDDGNNVAIDGVAAGDSGSGLITSPFSFS